jgi:hypothetical protein
MSTAIASYAYRYSLVAVAFAAACAAGGERTTTGGSAGAAGTSTVGTGGTIGVGGSGTAGSTTTLPPLSRTCDSGTCTDFPEAPLTDGAPPANAAERFGAAANSTSSGICLIEPQDDTLFPANWIRPRFRFSAAGGEDLFEIRLHAEREKYDLVVHTTNKIWTMPKEIWEGLAQNAFDEPVTVSVRGLVSSAPLGTVPSGTTASFTIAPVYAGGAMVYWAANGSYSAGGKTWLVGFSVGEEGTVDALTSEQVQEFPLLDDNGTLKRAETFGDVTYPEGKARCIGCHTSTPDGDAVAFVDSWPWNTVVSSVREEDVGARPAYVTAAGALIAQQPWLGAPTFSPAHWTDGDRVMLTSFGNTMGVGWPGAALNMTNQDRLVWMDLGSTASVPDRVPNDPGQLNASMQELEGTGFGFLARTGDPRAAVNPAWSHDGTTIAYTSTSLSADGHAGGVEGTPIQSDIYVVPYNDRLGGEALPLLGAADPTAVEYYPDFSTDDQFVAFTRAASSMGRVYYRPDGEIFVVPAAGGMAHRLAANDPPACSGQVSPGVINSWPKWSPAVTAANGKSYYWLIFSSGRAYPEQFEAPKDQYSPPDTHSSQLYVAGIVVENGQIISDHPAVYIWNQTKNTTNLTPAWDEFQIPPAVVK